jgi:hypothetical protein
LQTTRKPSERGLADGREDDADVRYADIGSKRSMMTNVVPTALPIALPIAVLDFEASSLSSNSYPIEAGWAVIDRNLAIHSDSQLIRPVHSWTDWSVKAEALHGLSRAELEAKGASPASVVAALEHAFAGMAVLSADPDHEAHWADRLYTAAGKQRQWMITDLRGAFEACLATSAPNARSWLATTLSAPRPHRAKADAHVFATILVALATGTYGSTQ